MNVSRGGINTSGVTEKWMVGGDTALHILYTMDLSNIGKQIVRQLSVQNILVTKVSKIITGK